MTLILMESCDLVNQGGYTGGRWAAGFLQDNQIVDGRPCWALAASAADQLSTVFAAKEDDVIWWGGRVWMPYFTFSHPLLNFREGNTPAGGTLHLSIHPTNGSGMFDVRRGGVSIGSSAPGAFPPNAWFYLEVKVTIHDTVGDVEVWVNGNRVLWITGADTRNGGTDGLIDTIGLGGPTSAIRVRDIYILNEQGSVNNDRLGPQRIQARLPSGAGNYAGWTPSAGANWQAVDETDPDDDSTYVEALSAALRDSYTLPSFDIADAINAVSAYPIARHTDAPFDLTMFLRRSATDADGTAQTPAGSYTQVVPEIWESDPIAAAAWTLANLNGTEVGILSS